MVPVIEHGSAAHLVLSAEEIPHVEYLCVGDTGYAELIAELWLAGKGFIVVEHDVAPWVGALGQLSECSNDWCMFRYPKGGRLSRGLGCTKFSPRLTQDYPHIVEAWRNSSWRDLDGRVGAAVAHVLRQDQLPLICYHDPPVAHVRRLED